MERLIVLGFVFLFLGLALIVFGALFQALQTKPKVEVGFGGFIGPIPIGFFTSWRAFAIWLILFAIAILIFILMRKF